MRRYKERVPDVKTVLSALPANEIQNDHIAFRTMGVKQLGIASLEKIFLHHGYKKRDFYSFPGKKLNAFWYSPPRPDLPRIFVSELRVADLSKASQDIIYSYTDEVKSDPVDALNLDDWKQVDEFLHRSLWRLPSWQDYSDLLKESEYAAWVIYNRYYLNHFTISVHNLSKNNTIDAFNLFLEKLGIKLNDSGGKIKISDDGKLLQSSTVAQVIDAVFKDGDTHPISGSYVEFAERKIIDDKGNRRDGFETANADKIFESTYTSQTKKRDSASL